MNDVPGSWVHQLWEGKLRFQKPSPLAVPQLLYQEWASYGVFYKYQPIDLVR